MREGIHNSDMLVLLICQEIMQTHKVFLQQTFMHVPSKSCAISYRIKATPVDRFTGRVCQKKITFDPWLLTIHNVPRQLQSAESYIAVHFSLVIINLPLSNVVKYHEMNNLGFNFLSISDAYYNLVISFCSFGIILSPVTTVWKKLGKSGLSWMILRHG